MINQKFKLYLSNTQEKTLEKYESICKLVWNLAVKQRQEYWDKALLVGPETYKKEYSPISEYGQSKELTVLKKEFDFLYEVPAGMLTNILTTVDLSYKMFFRNLKNNPKAAGKPRFKGKKDSVGLKFKDWKNYPVSHLNGKNYASIGLPKIGTLRFRLHTPILGKIRNCMVKREVDGWYLILAVDHELKSENYSHSVVGVDMGVIHTISLSDGTFIDLPKYIKETQERIAVLQRRNRNKKRGSANSSKAYKKIAKISATVARQKDYFLKMIAHDLTTKHRIIGVEKLNIKNMTRSAKGDMENPGTGVAAKSGLNKSILMNNWGFFMLKLEEMGKQNGCKIVFVNPKNTSQTCSSCGNIDKDNRRDQSHFVCTECGLEINADTNAAINIKHLALAGEVPVEMPSLDGSVKQECSALLDKDGRLFDIGSEKVG